MVLLAFLLLLAIVLLLGAGIAGQVPRANGDWRPLSRGWRIGLLVLALLLIGLLLGLRQGWFLGGPFRAGPPPAPTVWTAPAPIAGIEPLPTPDPEATPPPRPEPEPLITPAPSPTATATPAPMARAGAASPRPSSRPRAPAASAACDPHRRDGLVDVCCLQRQYGLLPEPVARPLSAAGPRLTLTNRLGPNQRAEEVRVHVDGRAVGRLDIDQRSPERRLAVSLDRAAPYRLDGHLTLADGSRIRLHGEGWLDPGLGSEWQVSLVQEDWLQYRLRLDPVR